MGDLEPLAATVRQESEEVDEGEVSVKGGAVTSVLSECGSEAVRKSTSGDEHTADSNDAGMNSRTLVGLEECGGTEIGPSVGLGGGKSMFGLSKVGGLDGEERLSGLGSVRGTVNVVLGFSKNSISLDKINGKWDGKNFIDNVLVSVRGVAGYEGEPVQGILSIRNRESEQVSIGETREGEGLGGDREEEGGREEQGRE